MGHPEHGLFELELDGRLQVVAPGGPRLPAAAPEGRSAAEERLEDVAQVGAEDVVEAPLPASGARPPEALGPEGVVAAATFGVAQGLVGDGDELEPVLRLGVTGVGVGVQLRARARYAFFSSSSDAVRLTPSSS